VINIIDTEKPDGVIVQFGGQTPLKLAVSLMEAGAPIIGTSPTNIDRAENRKLFSEVMTKLKLKQPENGTATTIKDAIKTAQILGYPVVVRPSYVLGGRAMEIVYDEERLKYYMKHALEVSPDHPILIDKFLENAIEVDVDAISDGNSVVIGGVMEHIEEAGIHSGDSACSLPTYSIKPEIVSLIKEQTRKLACELNVIGLLNIQFAVKDNEIYILEVNPRASRTIPFVSKATGVPLAKLAALVMTGKSLKELNILEEPTVSHIAVKESVFPFNKFDNVDILLGPEMKSTGEVMGVDNNFGMAFAKAQLATGIKLLNKGSVFISVKDSDKDKILAITKDFLALGYNIIATKGTALFLNKNSLKATTINKVKEGSPHIVDKISSGEIQFVVNTTFGNQSIKDSYSLRRASINTNIPYYTTIAGSFALLKALKALKKNKMTVTSLQEYTMQLSEKF
jgi:carbamoyl-phosphate synthase large subunit